MSCPAQKAGPAPAITTTLTEWSVAMAPSSASSAAIRDRVRALRAAGRLSVMYATPLLSRRSSSRVMVAGWSFIAGHFARGAAGRASNNTDCTDSECGTVPWSGHPAVATTAFREAPWNFIGTHPWLFSIRAIWGRLACFLIAGERCRRMSVPVSGTEGYANEAPALARQYESIAFADVHARIMHLVPTTPCRVLEIGAGTGRDAAGFAALGHRVLAVEPTEEMRTRAMALHASPGIEWLDDSLPDLARVMPRGDTFDVVMMTAVWMHLDARQRQTGMPNVASLVRPGGMMSITLRY